MGLNTEGINVGEALHTLCRLGEGKGKRSHNAKEDVRKEVWGQERGRK